MLDVMPDPFFSLSHTNAHAHVPKMALSYALTVRSLFIKGVHHHELKPFGFEFLEEEEDVCGGHTQRYVVRAGRRATWLLGMWSTSLV